MSLTYPQFGNLDYSGLTTEEELARRMALDGSARGSPLIGARMSPPTPIPAVQQELIPQEVTPPVMAAPAIAATTEPGSMSEAILAVLKTRPVTALDWIIIFVLIIAALCFIEYAGEFLRGIFGGSRHGHKHGGNFCSTCGGTV